MFLVTPFAIVITVILYTNLFWRLEKLQKQENTIFGRLHILY